MKKSSGERCIGGEKRRNKKKKEEEEVSELSTV